MLDKNREIVFLAATRVIANTKERFAIGELIDLGYKVTIIDLAQIIDPEAAAKVTLPCLQDEEIETKYFDHIFQFETFVQAHPKAYYFLLFDYYYEVRRVYDILTKYDVDYGNVSTALTDSLYQPSAKGETRLSNLKFRLSPERWRRILFNRVIRKSGRHKPTRFILVGGRNGEESLWNNCCTRQDVTKKIYIRSFDYERFLNMEAYNSADRPYAVFLDQGMPYHPDFLHSDEYVNPERYFEEIHEIFDVIRNQYGLDIIIAAHPRINYEDKGDVWRGCKVVYGQSPQLVKSATLVMTHTSNSITFAVMANKPALILLLPDWEHGYHNRQMCEYWSKQLAAPIIRTGEDLHERMDYQPDKKAYEQVRYLFTDSCNGDSRKFWEIALDEIE